MADKKISELTTDTPASGDEIPIHDISGGDTNKIAISDLAGSGLKAGSPLAVEPANFAGTGLSDDGTDNLAVDNYASLARLDLNEAVSGAWTFNADVTLGMPSGQNWLIEEGGTSNVLRLAGQTANENAILALRSADNDGSNFLGITFNVLNDLNSTDRERFQLRHNPNGPQHELLSNANGTGTAHPIVMKVAGNSDQMSLRSDGKVAMANSLKVGGTGAAANLLEVVGSGARAMLNGASDGDFSQLRYAENGTSRYDVRYQPSNTRFSIKTHDSDGSNTDADVIRIPDGTTEFRLPNVGSNTGTTAVFDANNAIVKDSSSRRYKSDITPITPEDVDPARVLAIDPTHYVWKESGRPGAGFMVEDFEWGPFEDGLSYDKKGRPEAFRAGSRVIDAAQQIVLRDHETRLSSTEAEIRELRSENQQLREQVRELKEAA